MVLHVSYYFLSFNMIDVETNFAVGYILIAAIGSYMLVYLVVIIFRSFLAIKLKLKKFCARRYQLSQRKELKSYLKTKHGAKKERMI